VRGSRWLIFAPVAILALFAPTANAEPIQGLNTTYYTIDEIPPVQSTTEYEECGSELENNINRSYDGEPYLDCTGDLFMVHMQGYIEIPEHDTIEFMLASDDGGEITIGGNTWGYWQDQGCSWMMSGELQLQAGPLPLELWMYENGGGSCVMLAWKIDDGGWEIVPEEAFSTNGDVSTTTTEVSTTTIQESTTTTDVSTTTVAVTTTVESTTTYLAPTTTLLEEVQTTLEQSTTSSSTTTTSTVVETTTTTEPVSPPTAQPPVEVQPEPIEEPATQDTEPIQEPEEPVEETIPLEPPDAEPEEPNTTENPDDTLPFVEDTEPDFVDDLPDFDLPEIDEAVVDIIIPETLPDAPEAPLSVEELETILDTIETVEALTEALEELTSEQAEQLIEAILEEEPTQEQATAIASSPAALAVLSSDQATQVFEALDVTELDNTQLEALAEAVTDAPTEVKEAFEESVDIFSEGLGTYVPVDSKIPVSERQTLIAIAAGATLTAASTRMRR
jgi:hypothetical protein